MPDTMNRDRQPDLERLGRFVRDSRLRLGLSQAQLARRVGWSQERVSVLEHGTYGLPSLPKLDRLATALDVPLADMLEALGYVVRDEVETTAREATG